MLRETLNVADFDGNQYRVSHTPLSQMAVGGAEGPKCRTELCLNGEVLPMVTKEYSYPKPGDSEKEAMAYFRVWARFRKHGLPVPDKMYLATLTPTLYFLFMSDVGIGLRRLVGFNSFMRQEEMDNACEPFTKKQYSQIWERMRLVEDKANSKRQRISFHNWHVGENKKKNTTVFLLDLGDDNYQLGEGSRYLNDLYVANRTSLVAFWNWLRV